MAKKPPPKPGFLDRIYIKNHPAPSPRRGDNGKIVSSSVILRSAIHYPVFRKQDNAGLLPNGNKSGDLVDPEESIEGHLGYIQFRPTLDKNGSQSFPKRPILDYGLGSNPQQIIDSCKDLSTPQLLAQTFVISIHPRFNALLEKHGIDPNVITAEYAIKFLREWYEYCGWGGDVEVAQVIHFELDEAGDPHYHAHAITPGTGYDAATDQRIPVPAFVPVELLQAGHTIADRLALEEMDRVLTRSWRLEIPEMVNTFYDPVDLPIPEPSSNLDAWFPRPQIPPEALIPRPEPPSLAETLFPNGVWESADSFGENDDINALVDGLFDDLVFKNTTDITIDLPIFEPNLVPPETDERADDGHHITPGVPRALIKTAEIQTASADNLPDNYLIADNNTVRIGTSKRRTRREITPISRTWIEPEPETPEQITQQIWSLIDHSDSSEPDDKSVNAVVLADALFPASIWTVADSFGDETIAQKIDELFGDWALDMVSTEPVVELFLDLALPILVPENAQTETEFVVEIVPETEELVVGNTTLSIHAYPELEIILTKTWYETLGVGDISARFEWVNPFTGQHVATESGIYLTTAMDYVFWDSIEMNLDDSRTDAKRELDTKMTLLSQALETGLDQGMNALYQSWFQTMALDSEGIERGFLPDLPAEMVRIDEFKIGADLERLPGVRWVHDDETNTDYGFTNDLATKRDDHYHLQFLRRVTDKNGLQQVEVIHINPHGQSLEDSAQTLWKSAKQFEHDFQINTDTEQLPLDVADDQDEQLPTVMAGDDIEDDLSDPEWDDNPGDNYDDWPDL